MSFIDDLAQIRDELAGEGGNGSSRRSRPRMRGLAIGRVVNLADLFCLGRVQVQVPSIDGLDLFPYARVIVPGGSLFSGIYWIPNIGDEVLVMFEDEDPDAAYILGGVWSATHMPPLPTPLAEVRTIRSPLGNQLVFTEVPPTLTIQSGPTPPVTIPAPPTPTGPIQTITLTSAGIFIIGGPTLTIACGDNVVTITPGGIVIETPEVLNIVAGGSLLSMSAAGIQMTAPSITMTSGALTMTAGGAVAVTAGGAVAVTAGGAASITAGATATVSAGAAATVLAGAAVTILAGAAATVVGGGGVMLVTATEVFKATPDSAPPFVPQQL